MPRSLSAALFILAISIPAAAAGTHPQDPSSDDPATTLAAIGERASRASALKDLWPLAQEVVELGKSNVDGEKKVDMKWVAALRKALPTSSPKAKLVLGQALVELDGASGGDVARALIPILEANGEEAAAAAAMLTSKAVRIEEDKEAKEIGRRLEDLIVQGGLSAPARLAASQALYRIGNAEQKTLARKELLAFYRSDDRDLKSEAALALAAIDSVDDVRATLVELQAEPSERGRLAKAYLDREDEERLWKSRIEKTYRLMNEKSDKGDSKGKRLDAGDPMILDEIMKMIRQRHIQGDQWSREELVAAAARGMLNELDPHSTFMTAEEYGRMVQELNQEYAGIGAQVRCVGINRIFTIIRPFFSGPAYKAGVRAGDQVISIITEKNGQRAEWATSQQEESEIIKRLKGEPGTKLWLKIARKGWVEPREYALTREQIQIPLLESELLPGGIGYFDVQQFGREATQQLVHDIEEMRKKGLKAVVLDLRYNPGGFLDAARDMCQVFLPKGSLVCYTEGRDFKRQEVRTRENPAVPDLPVAVLINNYSASASEITAGALQDHGRATILGERSYGKGSVQRLFELQSIPDEPFTDMDGNGVHDEWEKFDDVNGNKKYDGGPRVKLTVERYFLPHGRSINTEYDREMRKVKPGGIDPDVTVKSPDPDLAKSAEIERILSEDALVTYLREHFEANKDLFRDLAVNDGKDEARYPDFDKFYASLKTYLDKNEVRKLLRLRLRDKVAEDRGKMFPGYGITGDIEEDPQLREAVAILLKKNGATFESIPQYKALLDRDRAIGVNLGPSPDGTGKTADARKPEQNAPVAR